jgi:hypothetical protein
MQARRIDFPSGSTTTFRSLAGMSALHPTSDIRHGVRRKSKVVPIAEVNLQKWQCTSDIVMLALYGKVRVDLEFLRSVGDLHIEYDHPAASGN